MCGSEEAALIFERLTTANAAQYAAAGVDVLVSSWPYQAPPRDVQAKFICD